MPRNLPVDKNAIYRELPSVDELLRSDLGREIAEVAGAVFAAKLARAAVAKTRSELDDLTGKAEIGTKVSDAMQDLWRVETLKGTRRVINATGVIIHTNLGRAPLSKAAQKAMIEAAESSSVEYDLATGKRGRRGAKAEELIVELTGAEDALIVNNCAAAAFFVLTVFAAGGEAVISRGELVEIGGDFRVPDVLERSGAVLREVGTTNRTKLADYQKAVGKNTRMILRVHPSNYRIVGFTASPSVKELAAIARKNKIILYEDIGSGALVDLSEFGLADEPLAARSLKDGAGIVTFSGDKLLGGPQCGIIAGKKRLIDQLRKHPLHRALRIDKITLAALEATLEAYRRGTHFEEIPVLRQLAAPTARLERRAKTIIRKIGAREPLAVSLSAGDSAIGGGAAPDIHLRTPLLCISHKNISATELERRLRSWSDIPIATRIADGTVTLDMRTVLPDHETGLVKAIRDLF